MKLTYNPRTHRRCFACDPEQGQYPLRSITVVLDEKYGTPVLDCGHVDHPLAMFKELHPDWTWDEDEPSSILTPEKMRELANWLDTYDEMAKTFVTVCRVYRISFPDALDRALQVVQSDEVQRDLRKAADEMERR